MVQIKCLSNSLYSLKNYHIPFGMGFQPPRPYGRIPFEQHLCYTGSSLTSVYCITSITCHFFTEHSSFKCVALYNNCLQCILYQQYLIMLDTIVLKYINCPST